MYIEHEDLLGKWVYTTKVHESLSGYFEIGTKVKVIDKSYRGYDIEDEFGNRMLECGWII